MLQKISRIIFLALLFFFIFAMFNVKIWDPDFWWHLKTGEYISQTKSLLENDPFSFTSLPKDPIHPESKRIKFILTQYWLAQIIFYQVYKAFSLQGIIYMRALILAFLIFLLYKGIRREGAGVFSSVVLLIPAVIVFNNFTGERPQLFSFLFTFLLIYLLEGFRKASLHEINMLRTTDQTSHSPLQSRITASVKAELRYLIPVPLLMLIWANMHGGFILGIIIIIGYMFSELIKYPVKKFGQSLPPRSLKFLIICGILSLLTLLVNPNGYNVIPVLIEFNKSLYAKMIVEAKSPLVFLKYGYYTQELFTFFILLLAGVLLFLIHIKRLDITDIIPFAFFAGMSLSAARVIPFFTPIAVLMIARYGIKTFEILRQSKRVISVKKRLERPLSFLHSPSPNIFLSVLFSIILIVVLNNGKFFHSGVRKGRYPEGAARFLKENGIPGNMYNPYVWGGYLIWALYPNYKVFVDGRGLIEEIFFQSDKIIEASSLSFAGIPEWKALLNAYDINFIVTFSVGDLTGKLVPLVTAIYNDPEWHLIYMDNNSVIFLRDRPQNAEIIEKFGMPKEWVWNEVVTEAVQKALDFRNNANYYVTMGDAFFEKKSYSDALNAYLKAQQLSPDSSVVREKLDLLKNVNP